MRNIRFITLIIIISSLPLISTSQNFVEFIQEIQTYQDSVKLESSRGTTFLDSTTFDINTYLKFFDNITIDKGFTINVLYVDNIHDGTPFLYALSENEKTITKNRHYLYEQLKEPDFRAKNNVAPSDNENGFLQYLFFHEMGEQFALKAHSNIQKKLIICTKEELKRITNELRETNQSQHINVETEVPLFQVDLQELDNMDNINPSIEVRLSDEFCTIKWIENRTHSGIYKCEFLIQRKFPFEIQMTNEERLLEIITGFNY